MDDKSLPDEQRLLARLLHNYDNSGRPVFNASHAITVKFGLTLIQIADMVIIHIIIIINIGLCENANIIIWSNVMIIQIYVLLMI